jgi:hypothetical protein
MEKQVIATQALGLSVELTTDETYEEFKPYDPTDDYRHVLLTLKVGNTPIYTQDWMLVSGKAVEDQLEDAAAAMLTRLWGIESRYDGSRTHDILPKREYPETDRPSY